MGGVCYSASEGDGDRERCARCEVVPHAVSGGGLLHLRLPVVYTVQKVRRVAEAAGWETREADGVFTIVVPPGALPAYSRVMQTEFTGVERDAIRALFVADGHVAQLADYLEADRLERLIARTRLDDVAEVLESGRLTAAFQPIVDATSLAVFAHEGLLRLPPESPIQGPADLFRIARDTDTLPNADLAARRTIIAAAAGQRFDGNLFINFMPSSIYDAASCLRTTIAALDELGVAHDRIVFEVVESDEVVDVPHLLSTLAVYRRAGFKVALDDLGSGFASLNLLHALKPDFIKLDLELVRDVDSDAFKGMLASKLIEAARALGMDVIAEGVETEGEWRWLRDHGATYVQGYYIARPAAAMRTGVRIVAAETT
jgi:EAL domain-containing protein (putative c-di-GMP-specific phosphodiesterase class I)